MQVKTQLKAAKRSYVKPQLRVIELAAEDVMGATCDRGVWIAIETGCNFPSAVCDENEPYS